METTEPLSYIEKEILSASKIKMTLFKEANRDDTYVQIEVPSQLYGTTQACGTLRTAIGTGVFPCGDGCDYRLTDNDWLKIRDLLNT